MPSSVTPATASEWLVVLQDDPADEELRQEFETWLGADPAHLTDWRETQEAWELIGLTEPAHRAVWADAGEASARPIPDSKQWFGGSAQGARRGIFGLTLGGALAAGLALFLVSDADIRLKADHFSGTATVTETSLADGSSVILAPGTGISVSLSPTERRIALLSGQALFAVSSDPTRPFQVVAGETIVTVHGTEFEVGRVDDAVDVSVRHGSVSVGNGNIGDGLHAMTAGDRIRVFNDGRVVSSRIRPDQIAAWEQRRLLITAGTVDDVVEALRPWFDGAILIKSDRLGRQPITGVYNLGTPEKALRAVAQAQGAKVYRITPWLLLIADS